MFAICDSSLAQKQWIISYRIVDTIDNSQLLSHLPSTFTDSLKVLNILQQSTLKLQEQGYLAASIDSAEWKKDTLIAFLYTGRKFNWSYLHPGNVTEGVLRDVGFHEKMYRNHLFKYQEITQLEETILSYAEERGYPFATIRLDSIQIDGNQIKASLNYQPGVYIVFDTIRIVGTARLKRKFLENWLRILPGQPYSQVRLSQAYELLRQQSYLLITEPYEVTFKNDRAYITFYADAGKSSEADGIVGFQPNEQNEGRLLLTGELNLKLNNLFNAGGSFLFSWKQIKKGSPQLNISYTQPAFLKTPLEIAGLFQLLREDTSSAVLNGYVTLSQQINLFYNLNGWNKIGVGVQRYNSRLADSTIQGNGEQANLNWLSYSVYYTYRHLDNSLYPKKGWWLNASLSVGNKQVSPTDQMDLQRIETSSTQLSYRILARKYSRTGKKGSILLQISGGQIFNSTLFQNELFRLGGLTTLRGFNENFFFASDYLATTLEYRFFWEPTSYLFAFYDQAWLKTRILQNSVYDTPSGLGAGISFSTRAGIFNIVYALGNSQARAFSLGYSKIHFGLTSRF